MRIEPIITLLTPPFPYLLEEGKSIFQPGDQHPNRNHLGVFDLIFVKSGRLFLGEGDQQWEVASGQILILLPDQYHYSVKPCEEETLFYWLHFQTTVSWQEGLISSPTSPDEVNSYRLTLPKYWTLPLPEQMSESMQQLIDHSTQSRSHSFWQKQQLFLDILKTIDAGQQESNVSPAIAIAEKAEAFIKRNYKGNLTNKTLAEELHFHPNYIARCMKEIYQVTPMEFLLYYRLEQAKLLLLKTDWPVSRVAEEVGFQYTPYFSRCFRSRFNSSPLQFRKRYIT